MEKAGSIRLEAVETCPNPRDTFRSAEWSLARRIAFRFGFAYFVSFALYALDEIAIILSLQIGSPLSEPFPEPIQHALIPWVGKHILHLPTDITVFTNGSSDTTYDWVLTACDLCFAAIVAALWSILDRARSGYSRLLACTLFAMRILLAAELLTYGLDKVFPDQFGSFGPTDYLKPLGTFAPQALLWDFMASSTGYTIFAGSVELLGAILLPFRRTALLGALLSFLALSNVFSLNVFYDVCVKAFSFQLLLLSAFLLIADNERLIKFFLLGRATTPYVQEPLFGSKHANSIAQWSSVALLAVYALTISQSRWISYRNIRAQVDPASPVYGVWVVDDFELAAKRGLKKHEGAENRWQHIAFDSSKSALIESADLSETYASVKLDPQHRVLTLDADPTLAATFAYKMPVAGQMIVEGTLNGDSLHATLHRLQSSVFQAGGIHIITEHPP